MRVGDSDKVTDIAQASIASNTSNQQNVCYDLSGEVDREVPER